MSRISFDIEHRLKQFQLNSTEFETTLKQFFNPFNALYPFVLYYFNSFINQIKMKEVGTDIIFFTESTKESIETLEQAGYKETQKDFYPFSFVNASQPSEEIFPKVSKNVKKKFIYAGSEYEIYHKRQAIFFYHDSQEFLSMKVPEEYAIKEAYYCDNGFLDILVEEESTQNVKLFKTHLALSFFNFEYESFITTFIEDIETLMEIDFNYDFDFIMESNLNYMIIVKDGIKKKIDFVKKYYFEESGKIYFNVSNETDFESLKGQYDFLRTEHIFFYDFINLLGLDELKELMGKEFNSFVYKKLLSKHAHFDNTLNGALNFMNIFDNKDFYVDKKTELAFITGNFNYENLPGNYKIKYSVNKFNDEVEVIFYLLKNNIVVKRVKAYSLDRKIYFCNLEFNFYNYEYSNSFEEIDIVVTDNYNAFFENVFERDDYSKATYFAFLEGSKEYLVNNKVETNISSKNKKETMNIVSSNSNLFIKSYIESDSSRSSILDKEIALVDKENRPSVFWQNVEDKNYYLQNKQDVIKKRIFLKQNEDSLFTSNEKTFSLNLVGKLE